SEALRRGVAGAGEGDHAPAFGARDLRHQVRRGAEAVDSEGLRFTGEAQRAIADEAPTEERRRLQIGVAVPERTAESRGGTGPLRESSVDVVAGETRGVAQVLAVAPAEPAATARPSEPGYADAVADGKSGGVLGGCAGGFDDADDLV